MSKTFYMSDGDLFIDDETGRVLVIDGITKCNQDIAESLMSEFDPTRPYGNELINFQSQATVLGYIAEDFVRVKLDECIRRLMDMQKSDSYSTPDERIGTIQKILVKDIGDSSYSFWVQVQTEDTSASTSKIMVISLRHVISEQIERALASFKDKFLVGS